MGNNYVAAFASDIHFPLQDSRMVTLWMEVLKYLKPKSIDLLGDVDSAESTSRWVAEGSGSHATMEDSGVRDTRNFLADLHSAHPKADKHLHDGNHGWYRHEKYLDKNAPTVLDYINADSIYEYTKSGFEFHKYNEAPVKRHGPVYCHHGESISKHAGESVRNDCLSMGISLVRGHSHRQGQWSINYPITGQSLHGWEIGHMCDTSKITYDTAPNWQAGFAYALVDGENVHMNLVEIKDHSCYVAGKLFTA